MKRILILLVALTELAWAAETAQTAFRVSSEPISKQQAEILSIPGASALEVTVSGQLNAKDDILRIYNLEGYELKRFSGDTHNHDLDKIERFSLPGEALKVTFNSHGKTRRAGFTVSIAAASPVTDFNRIKAAVIRLVDKISTNGAGMAHQEIAKNLALLESLPAKMDTKSDDKQRAQPLINGLLSISKSYASVAAMRDQIAKDNEAYFAELQENHAKTVEGKTQTEDRIRLMRTEISRMQQTLQTTTKKIDRLKLDVSIKGRRQILRSLERQMVVWDEFARIQNGLLEKLGVHRENLDLLLHILEVNSVVYREAAYVLQMRQNLPDAGVILADLSDVLGVLGDLEANWSDVNGLKNRIEEKDFGE